MKRLLHGMQMHRKYILIGAVGITILYAASALVLYVSDSGTFKGGTNFHGILVENLTPEQASTKISDYYASNNVSIKAEGMEQSGSLLEYGLDVDAAKLNDTLAEQKLRYALFPFIYQANFELPYKIDSTLMQNKLLAIDVPEGKTQPANAYVKYPGNMVEIVSEKPGDGISVQYVSDELQRQLKSRTMPISIATSFSAVTPLVTKDKLAAKLPAINATLEQTYILTTSEKSQPISSELIAPSLSLDAADNIVISSPDAQALIAAAAKSFEQSPVSQIRYQYSSRKAERIAQPGEVGKHVANQGPLAAQLQNALAQGVDYTGAVALEDTPYETKAFLIADATKKVLQYQIVSWGKVATPLHEFREKAAETLLSELGWSRANYTFEEVTSGGDFMLVLSEGAELARRYPGSCDAFYSCRVGQYVIVNDSRWQNATPVWTKSLRDYQHLVINHEVGHLLGNGHSFCANPGDPAPVMQQQSIDLRSCTFNSWPLQSEIDAT